MRFSRRRGATGLFISLASAVTAVSAATIDLSGFSPGASVVGPGVVHPLLFIHDSDGNDVVVVRELTSPVAYGANPDGALNVANGCLGSGFADLGSGPFTTKKHEYVFTFAPGTAVETFSTRMRDWGDFLPFGATADRTYGFAMTAYDVDGNVVDTDSISFSSADSTATDRETPEFGNLSIAGDACTAPEGYPGNYVFTVAGSGITRVELNPRDRPSLDPHIAFSEIAFEVEPLGVGIDIKPGSSTNPISRKSKGTLPVAVLGSPSFNASSVDPSTVTLEGVPVAANKNGKLQASLSDVSGDRRADLVVHFSTELLPKTGMTFTLRGATSGGRNIRGSDRVAFVP
jgi:hypothetical protein